MGSTSLPIIHAPPARHRDPGHIVRNQPQLGPFERRFDHRSLADNSYGQPCRRGRHHHFKGFDGAISLTKILKYILVMIGSVFVFSATYSMRSHYRLSAGPGGHEKAIVHDFALSQNSITRKEAITLDEQKHSHQPSPAPHSASAREDDFRRHNDEQVAKIVLRGYSKTDARVRTKYGSRKTTHSTNDAANFCHTLPMKIQQHGINFESNIGKLASHLTIRNNHTVAGFVERDAFQFYQVCIALHGHDHYVRVDLRPEAGSDADLFLSASNPFPREWSSSWISRDRGPDVITIPTFHSDFPLGGQMLYVGIFGRDRANFSVQVDIWDVQESADIDELRVFHNEERQRKPRLP